MAGWLVAPTGFGRQVVFVFGEYVTSRGKDAVRTSPAPTRIQAPPPQQVIDLIRIRATTHYKGIAGRERAPAMMLDSSHA
jgi:hypothetical protein